jgi:hypothetical protein
MGWQRNFLYPGVFAVVLCAELVALLIAPQLKAQSQLVSVTFPPASSIGAPGRTVGGGQRSPDCVNRDNPSLTVLAPTNNVGTTISSNPTLFWYIPRTKAQSAKFMVLDGEENEVYETTLALTGVPGVVKLSLPKTVSLAPGKTYRWVLMLECNSEDHSMDAYVQGNLERRELSVADKAKLAQATQPLQKAEVYAGASIWQETVSILAQLRHDRPSDPTVIAAWKELLKSVKLDAIANEPLVECCTANSGVNGQ